MSKETIPLRNIAYARSGDKGNSSNIRVIAYTQAGYEFLVNYLTPKRVEDFFQALHPSSVKRYELSNLGALNFLLNNSLAGGGSLSLRIDSQGKAPGQAILEMNIEVPAEKLKSMLPKSHLGGHGGPATHPSAGH